MLILVLVTLPHMVVAAEPQPIKNLEALKIGNPRKIKP
jgi:hypothetical protein